MGPIVPGWAVPVRNTADIVTLADDNWLPIARPCPGTSRRLHCRTNLWKLEPMMCRIIDHFTVMAWQIIHKHLVCQYLTHDKSEYLCHHRSLNCNESEEAIFSQLEPGAAWSMCKLWCETDRYLWFFCPRWRETDKWRWRARRIRARPGQPLIISWTLRFTLKTRFSRKIDLLTVKGIDRYIRSRVESEVIWIEGWLGLHPTPLMRSSISDPFVIPLRLKTLPQTGQWSMQ